MTYAPFPVIIVFAFKLFGKERRESFLRQPVVKMLFYKKLFKSTILLCTLFSLLITVCIGVVSYHYIKNEYIANAGSAIDRISQNLEYNLQQIQGLPALFKSNDDIKSYIDTAIPSSEDEVNAYMYLRFSIGAMPNNWHDIGISKISDNKIITNKSSSTFDYFINSYNLPKSDIDEMLNAFSENPLANTAAFVSSKGEKYYFIVFFCDRHSFKEDYFIVSVYDVDNIVYLPFDAIFSLQNDDRVIYCSDNTVIGKTDDRRFLSKYTVVSKKYGISNLLGSMTYTVFIPKMQYFTFVSGFAIIILPIVLLLVLLSYIISKKYSNRIYSPVKQLVNQVSDISPSGIEDEFKSISSTISQLTQQNAKYQDDIVKNRATLKNKFFHDLFTGFLSKEQIEAGISQYLGNIDSAFPLSVIIVSIPDNISDGDITEKNDTYSINVLIYNLFKNAFSDSDFFNFIIISPLVYGIVMSCDDISDLQHKLKQVALKAENTINLNINSYIGESINSREELPSAFFSTYMSYAASFGNNPQLVTASSDISDITIYPLELENKIFSACINCQKTQLEQLLDFLFNKKLEAKDVSQNMNYYISTLFYSTCMRVLTHLNISTEDVFGTNYNIYLELRNCHSFVEIHDRLREIFLKIMDYVMNKKASLNQQYCDDMLEFVKKNYNNQDFTLAVLAEYMNMSQAYVSKLFKKLTNYNFKEYLTNIRIEKGTELLINNSDMPIKEIANLVGYSKPEPFTKAFIQIHNVSPSDYLKNNSQDR